MAGRLSTRRREQDGEQHGQDRRGGAHAADGESPAAAPSGERDNPGDEGDHGRDGDPLTLGRVGNGARGAPDVEPQEEGQQQDDHTGIDGQQAQGERRRLVSRDLGILSVCPACNLRSS